MNSWLKNHKDSCLLLAYIRPDSSKNEVCGLHGDRLKIKIKAPPIDGEANAELIKFLSKVLDISKSKIQLLRGDTSRQKDLLLDMPLSEALIKLEPFL